jgi:hypothetical protein
MRQQAITGLTPPQVREAMIREVWPSVAAYAGPASLGRALIRSIVAAPLGWLVLLPFYFKKILPFLAQRYTLTNRRVMIRRGLRPRASHEVALSEIDQVNLKTDHNSGFYRAGTLELVSAGRVLMTLPGVPEPESFRQSILNASTAWVPDKSAGPFVPASAS